MSIPKHFSKQLSSLKKEHLLRQLFNYEITLPHDKEKLLDNNAMDNVNTIKEGKKFYTNFSSNDYLNLSKNQKVINQSIAYLKKYGAGNPSSRLISGNLTPYGILEKKIASFKQTEAALIFPSGYMANVGIIPAITDSESMIFFDRLCHASIIDGILLSKSKWVRYNHNDIDHLKKLLEAQKHIKTKLIVTESVFSMDGDIAPLKKINGLALKYKAYLYVDEAHSTGIFGKRCEGLCTENGLHKNKNVLIMGTFGKAIGNYGAYFAGSKLMKEWLINKARTLIYTTALPMSILGGVLAALDYLKKNPKTGKQLLQKSNYFRDQLIKNGIPLIKGDSQIVSILTGTNKKTLALSQFLKNKGVLAVPIRPPTVEKGKGRIRFTINTGHTKKQLDHIVELIKKIKF